MLTPPSDNPFYEREAEIIRICGWTAAGVYDVLRHLTGPDGSGPTHQVVAQKLGIGTRTAQRSIDKLISAGVIKAETRYAQGHQITNRYSFPTTWAASQNDQAPASQNDQALSTNDERRKEDFSSLNLYSGHDNQGVGLRPTRGSHEHTQEPGEEPQGVGEAEATAGADSLAISGLRLPPPGTPMPVGNTRNFFEREKQASWLTVYFEGLVIDRDNRLLEAKGQKLKTTVGPARQRKFLDAARRLLSGSDAPELTEVVSVLDSLFTTWHGYLPFVEDTDYPSDGKITRFWQISNNYHQLLAVMGKSETPPILPITTGDDETMAKPKAYYDHGEGFPFEDKIPELVEGWLKTKTPGFRARYVDDDDDFDDDDDDLKDDEASTFDELFAWRKTFRIMLDVRKIGFDDIKLVVDALGDKRLRLDFARYPTPYDMVRKDRPGEWEKLLASVKLALLREQMMPSATPKSPSSSWDDNEDGYGFSWRPDDVDERGSVDMATGADERHRRYLARVARRTA